MNKSFFSKDYIYPAIWTIVIAIIAFLVGLGWETIWGPEKVVIIREGSDNLIDTTVTVYKLEGDSATIDALRNYNSNLTVDSKTVPTQHTASIKRPKFKFPPIKEGYRETGINTFATVNLPRVTYTQDETIKVELRFFDKTTLNKITPIFIDVTKRLENNHISSLWGEQFTAIQQQNLIEFSANFPKGEYTLSIGFYFMDEINQKYPTIYARKYKIKIL